MQEPHAHLGHDLAARTEDEQLVVAERTNVGQFDFVAVTDGLQRGDVGYGQHHALLRFRQPHFPGRQPGVLSRYQIEIDRGPESGCQLANRGRQPAGTAVGDGRIQPGITSSEDNVDQTLLHDRVTDLHAGSGHVAGGGIHGHGGERGATNAVTTGTSADDHDAITRARLSGV